MVVSTRNTLRMLDLPPSGGERISVDNMPGPLTHPLCQLLPDRTKIASQKTTFFGIGATLWSNNKGPCLPTILARL
jgi:hypothetical protein